MFLALTNPFGPDMLPLLLQVVLLASLVNVSCALVGSFLVLRRMSMMGDALSHAVLPGLVIAFLFSGSLGVVPMFLGAIAAGIATTFLTQALHQYGHVSTDASMGVVFTSFFAVGVVLLKRYASNVHLDVSCVYEGSLLWLAMDTETVAGLEIPRQVAVVLPVLLINLAVMTLLWKEFKLTTFDAALATSMGFSAPVIHYLLMALVAMTAVASFRSVGSILVVAMLIVPPASAQLLVHRLGPLLAVACAIGVFVAAAGATLAIWLNVEPPGMMAVVAGVVYGLTVLFSPTSGLLSRALFHRRTASRILREDLLAMLYRVHEHDADQRLSLHEAIDAVGGGAAARRAFRSLRRQGDLRQTVEGLALTDQGRATASQLVRTHRLWETYLVEELGLALDHVHEPAHRIEHFIDEEIREQLAKSLPQSAEDPHGRDIPE